MCSPKHPPPSHSLRNPNPTCVKLTAQALTNNTQPTHRQHTPTTRSTHQHPRHTPTCPPVSTTDTACTQHTPHNSPAHSSQHPLPGWHLSLEYGVGVGDPAGTVGGAAAGGARHSACDCVILWRAGEGRRKGGIRLVLGGGV